MAKNVKRITCEMCGSNDLIKKDAVFECQNCGTKYSVEEAKKMMIEGTVDVSGSKVKVDNSDKLENFLTLADHAFEAHNYKEAENYCNKVIENDVNNYKAWILKGKVAGWQSSMAKLRLNEMMDAFLKAKEVAPENEKEDVEKIIEDNTEKVIKALIQLCSNHYEDYPSDDNGEKVMHTLDLGITFGKKFIGPVSRSDFKNYILDICLTVQNAIISAWNNHIYKDYNKYEYPLKDTWIRFKDNAIYCTVMFAILDLNYKMYVGEAANDARLALYEADIAINEVLINSCSWKYENGRYREEWALSTEAKEKKIDYIMRSHEEIKKLDPDYEIPPRPVIAKSSGGCYVATCVYGSYDCPEVWTLRRYSDYTLAKSWYGRLFIRIYYAVSPTLVKWFGHTRWFKKMWKGKLDKMVTKLQSEGIENTPYEDRNW